MVNSKIGQYLIPSVTKLPANGGANPTNSTDPTSLQFKEEAQEFKNFLNDVIAPKEKEREKEKVIISGHALKRLSERNLGLDKEELKKIENAIERLKMKGGQDSLVITDKAAYIVDVAKNVVVTAIDKESLNENVFTKIDSTILMN